MQNVSCTQNTRKKLQFKKNDTLKVQKNKTIVYFSYIEREFNSFQADQKNWIQRKAPK